jgi:hypothetical protein
MPRDLLSLINNMGRRRQAKFARVNNTLHKPGLNNFLLGLLTSRVCLLKDKSCLLKDKPCQDSLIVLRNKDMEYLLNNKFLPSTPVGCRLTKSSTSNMRHSNNFNSTNNNSISSTNNSISKGCLLTNKACQDSSIHRMLLLLDRDHHQQRT